MSEKLRTEPVSQSQPYKVITFPLYIPLIIVIGFIILFFNILNNISTYELETISGISKNPLSTINQEETKMSEEKINMTEDSNAKNNIVGTNTTEKNIIETNEKVITVVLNQETDVLNIKKDESSTKATVNKKAKEEKKQTTTKENNEIKKDKIYTASNGEKYTIIGKLSIPSLNIKSDILSSTSEALMKIALNKYWGANPNEVGNMVVVGHNYRGTKFFGKLYNIKIGDIVKITDSKGKTLDYKVYDKYVIDPYDNKCTSQLTNGKTEITLITCYNNGTQRLVVKARVE